MSKKRGIIVGFYVVVVALLVVGYILLTGSHGRLIARAQKTDAGGYTHTVTVRQFLGRFRTELGDEGAHGRILPVSSYELYEGSMPIKSATITWPELHTFSVAFDNGIAIDCSWSSSNAIWTIH
jgi:hypothetical protein